MSAVHADRVEFDDGSTIPARTLCGAAASPALPSHRAPVPYPAGGTAGRGADLTVDGFPVFTRSATWRTSRPEMKLPQSCPNWVGRAAVGPMGGGEHPARASG